MAGFRNPGSANHHHGGAGYKAGHWRPDAPTGTVAVPEGPQGAICRPDEPLTADGRKRDPRTAANLQAREDALLPRRWRPPTPDS